MLIRFLLAVLLLVLVAVAGGALEKSTLDLRRAIGKQHYRTEVLRERVARLRLRSQELGGPTQLLGPLEAGRLEFTPAPAHTPLAQRPARSPLLHWRALPNEWRALPKVPQ